MPGGARARVGRRVCACVGQAGVHVRVRGPVCAWAWGVPATACTRARMRACVGVCAGNRAPTAEAGEGRPKDGQPSPDPRVLLARCLKTRG